MESRHAGSDDVAYSGYSASLLTSLYDLFQYLKKQITHINTLILKIDYILWKLEVCSKFCSVIFPLFLFPTCACSFLHHQCSHQIAEGVTSDEATMKHCCLSKPIVYVRVHSLFIDCEFGEIQNDIYPCHNMIIYNTFHALKFSFSPNPLLHG